MRLKVRHVTRFTYDTPIVDAHTELRLRPADDNGQRCNRFEITAEPRLGAIDDYADRFGTHVHHFDVLDPHDHLEVGVESEVSTADAFAETRPPSALERWDFLQPTRYVPLDGTVAGLADGVVEGRVATVAHELMERVRGAMTYESGTTNVHTRADEALRDGRGVCQDFAHVLIGVCRSRGIATRYVSGYLFDPKINGGESESHAWVDVFDDDRGWISLDPTHGTEQTDRYVRIGVGRDYADVSPTRGVYKGTATESLEVSVRIELLPA